MQLDPSFGIGGKVLTDIAGPVWEDEHFTLIVQPDGKLVAPGKAYNSATGDFDFVVIRYNSNGSLDSSFDGDGKAITDIAATHDEALGLVRQADGKLVAAGVARNGALGDFALVRYNADGSLDTSFGTGGRVRTDFFGADDVALGLVVQPDGKLVAGGYATLPQSGVDFALARYNTNGSLDPSFGIGGISTTDFFGSSDWAFRLTIQSDGKLVAVGGTANTSTGNSDFAIARYNSNGRLDASFATFGKAGVGSTDFSNGTDYALAVLVQPDGGILAGGLAYGPGSGTFEMALARYLPDGTLDQNFATYGKKGVVTTDFFGDYDQMLALALQPDGKILAAGHAKHPKRNFEFALARYNPDGTRDTSFGYGGLLSTDFFGGPDGVHGLVLQEDGKAVVAGDAFNPNTGGDDFALARYRVADPDWIAGVVSSLPAGAFNAAASRTTILAALDQVEATVTAGQIANAITQLQSLRQHLNGCPLAPDADDWIIDCTAQTKVRVLVDEVTSKLQAP
ncbi:MAG: hypothetical protein Q7T33_03085 [Dehalococcoidia bacterium]|nr:hypothetical protein [Dehalococcoidia bacterium]